MKRAAILLLGLAAGAGANAAADENGRLRATTAGSIAIANLDHQIAQSAGMAGSEDLLLARARFLGDYDALDRAAALAESRASTAEDLLRRARTRAAAHRFDEALADLDAAASSAAVASQREAVRAAVLVATGRAAEALPSLREDAQRQPGYAASSALAIAYAELGRYEEADRAYAAATEDLRTTSPFPYAWLYFARGKMWSEQAGDRIRGEAFYAIALAYLPEFAVANIHLAEMEVARGEWAPAQARLDRVVARSDEPEAWALLGEIRLRLGDCEGGARAIEHARRRYETLLATQLLAFADHAAEFYLGPGADVERAWALAGRNLANRKTARAYALAIRAATASGRDPCPLAAATRGLPGAPDPPQCR